MACEFRNEYVSLLRIDISGLKCCPKSRAVLPAENIFNRAKILGCLGTILPEDAEEVKKEVLAIYPQLQETP